MASLLRPAPIGDPPSLPPSPPCACGCGRLIADPEERRKLETLHFLERAKACTRGCDGTGVLEKCVACRRCGARRAGGVDPRCPVCRGAYWLDVACECQRTHNALGGSDLPKVKTVRARLAYGCDGADKAQRDARAGRV